MTTFFIFLGGACIWIGCGIVSFGLNFAYFQREFPTLARCDYEKDRIQALFWSFGGPVSLFVSFLCFGARHGLKWR